MQGEREIAKDNRTLGKFQLQGIPPAPRGVPQIEVTFDIDVNGILNVSAVDLATDQEQKVTISASTGLTEEEAERMRADAESHAEEDRNRLAEVEARNQCGARVYQVEKLLEENRQKLSDSDIRAVEEALDQCRRALADGAADRIRSASEALDKATCEVAEALHRSSTAAGAAADAGSGEGSKKRD